MVEAETPGTRFARAFTAKDFAAVLDLLDPDVDFRGLTPNRAWEAQTAEELVASVLRTWLDDDDRVEGIDRIETDTMADRERVGYRFTVSNPDGRFVVEQQAYLMARDGRIVWMRALCTGFRPLEPAG